MALTTGGKEIPVRIVGSSVFGRYPTVSIERTYNLFITTSGDGEQEWLVNFAGFAGVLEFFDNALEGRGIYHSVRGNFLLVVVGAVVFRVNLLNEIPTQLGTIATNTGEIFFDENLSSQVCFVDGQNAYIYNYEMAPTKIGAAVFNNLASPTTVFLPNYVTYQNTYFIFGNSLTTNAGSQWVIFEQDTGDTPYSLSWVQTLTLQTKPDFAKAVKRIPGKGNNVIVFGSTVAELWTNIGGLQVYQRNSSINIDYGALSVSTIAANDEVVVWLGINETSSPALMVMTGGGASRISTDGFDYLLETVKVPASSTAFLYRQGGHLFYILSFIDPKDNFSIMYDFTMKKFYDVTDWDFTTFPARNIVYYNNLTFFISYKDGKIYQLSSDLTQYDLTVNQGSHVDKIYQIPRVRLTDTYRLESPEKYKINLFTFVVESGTTPQAYDDVVCFGYILTEDTFVPIYTEDGLPILVEGGYCYTNKPRI